MVNHKKILILFLFTISLIYPLATLGVTCRKLEVQFPGLTSTCLPVLPDYIMAIYRFSLMVVGIICLGAFIYGGFRYLTSVGSPAAINDARDQIFSALLGLIILFSAWLILNTINPQLVVLNPMPGGGCTKDSECPMGNTCDIPNKVCVTTSKPPDWLKESCVSYNTEGDCIKNLACTDPTDPTNACCINDLTACCIAHPSYCLPYCEWCHRCDNSDPSKINTFGADACVKYAIPSVCIYTSTNCPPPT